MRSSRRSARITGSSMWTSTARHQIGGSYQQVTLTARELAPSLLSANAQTWVNLHLLFTHGTGVVMSPVKRRNPPRVCRTSI